MRQQRAGFFIGFAAVTSVAVGLETAPFVITAFAGLILLAALHHGLYLKKLRYAAAAILGLTLPYGFAFIGPAAMAQTMCDSYSAPWIAALILISLILFAITYLWERPSVKRQAFWVQLTLLAAPGLLALILLAALFPSCLKGPYAMIDGYTQQFWLHQIMQEWSMWKFFTFISLEAFSFIIFIFTALALLPKLSEWFRSRDDGKILIVVIALSSLALLSKHGFSFSRLCF